MVGRGLPYLQALRLRGHDQGCTLCSGSGLLALGPRLPGAPTRPTSLRKPCKGGAGIVESSNTGLRPRNRILVWGTVVVLHLGGQAAGSDDDLWPAYACYSGV